MSDIFKFESEHWDLVIWTRDNDKPKKILKAVLEERGKNLPDEEIFFSFPLTGGETCCVDENKVLVSAKSSSIKLPQPLCYENRDYEFEFTFKDSCKADRDNPVIHRLSEIENSFRCSREAVRGVVNFGNNVGWFRLGIRYHKDGKEFRDFISLKVYPTKMDMKNDLDLIGKVIDEQYPLWRFSIAQKTDSILSRSHKKHESFELLWIAQFKSLADELASAVKVICRSPHSRLLPFVRSVKAERIKGRISGKLEELIAENLQEKQYNKRYRIEKRKLFYDTPENRFVKMVLFYSVKKLKMFSYRVKQFEKNPDKARLSKSFFAEIRQITLPFEKLSSEPLFREIGAHNGQMRESLVLHQRTGYAKVYRIWQQLKLYLDFFGSDASISVRSVEQLYEIWCLLEVKNLLMKLGFEEKIHEYHLKTAKLEKNLNDTAEQFNLVRPDGMKAVLIHEPTYNGSKKFKFDKIYSWTTTQRPDIFLEVTLPSKDKVRWVFDAKYRIDSNDKKKWPQEKIDTVPDDAVNQMHRYRDSLIYISEADEDGEIDKSRPIIGAFALYPGWFNQDKGKNPYQESIDAVGIGAFPLLPGRDNKWLADFLKEQLGEYHKQKSYNSQKTDNLFLQESVRIPTYGMKQYRHNDLILAADISDSKGVNYVKPFQTGVAKWYHIPESTVNNYKISRHVMREIRYCAFTVNEESGRVCRYVYPVESIVLKPRKEIDEYAGGENSAKNENKYWLIKLGKSFNVPVVLAAEKSHRSFYFRLVTFNDFLEAGLWDDIPRKYLN